VDEFINYDWEEEFSGIPLSGCDGVAAIGLQQCMPIEDDLPLPELMNLPSFDNPEIFLQLSMPCEEVKDTDNGIGINAQFTPTLFESSIFNVTSIPGDANLAGRTWLDNPLDTTWLNELSQPEVLLNSETLLSPMDSCLNHSGTSSQSPGLDQACLLERQPRYACSVCKRSYVTRRARDNHEKSHPRFACTVQGCPKASYAFRKKRDLERHVLAVHGTTIELPCKTLMKRRKDNILRHQKTCEVCSKNSAGIETIISMMTIKNGE